MSLADARGTPLKGQLTNSTIITSNMASSCYTAAMLLNQPCWSVLNRFCIAQRKHMPIPSPVCCSVVSAVWLASTIHSLMSDASVYPKNASAAQFPMKLNYPVK